MPRQDRLHRGKPSKGQKPGERVHAQFGVNQQIELMFAQRLTGLGQVSRQMNQLELLRQGV
jgi:hypothetical protein